MRSAFRRDSNREDLRPPLCWTTLRSPQLGRAPNVSPLWRPSTTDPREVVLPAELLEALNSDPEARARFESMAFTHRKEYARWISEAKREETRQQRVGQALEMIRAGKTRS